MATVDLREGALWSDGTPFTADDVVFTYNVLSTEVEETRMASLFGGRWSLFCPESLAYVEKVGDYQVKYAFFRPSNLRKWAFVQRNHWEPKFQAPFQTEDPAASLLALIPEDERVLGAFRAVAWDPGFIVLYEHGGALIYDSAFHLSLEAYGGAQGRSRSLRLAGRGDCGNFVPTGIDAKPGRKDGGFLGSLGSGATRISLSLRG